MKTSGVLSIIFLFIVGVVMIYNILAVYKNTAPLNPHNLNNCVVSGCSSHICAEEKMITTCEFRPEYACYRKAQCARQTDGRCGWTRTAQLNRCLNNTQLFPETTAPL